MHTDKQFTIEHISPSGLSTLAACPFKYMLKHLMGVKQPTQSVGISPQDYGRLLHQCLPLCLDGTSLADVLSTFDSLWLEGKYDETNEKRNKVCGRLLLEGFYKARHQDCPYTIEKLTVELPKNPTHEHVSPSEIPFELDIGGPFAFVGLVDLPVRLKTNKSFWALDFKTTSEVTDRFFSSFSHHPQTLGYSYALTKLTGIPCSGLLLEAVRVAALPKTSRLSTATPLMWQPIYAPDHMQQWFVQWARTMSGWIEFYNSQQLWPRNPCACSSYSMFGIPGGVCPYQSICDVPESKWQDQLKFYELKQDEPVGPATEEEVPV